MKQTETAQLPEPLRKNHGRSIIVVRTEWQGVTYLMKPIIEDMASRFSDKIAFHFIEYDEQASLVKTFDIESVLTLLFFNDGVLIDKIVGPISAKCLNKRIRSIFFHEHSP